MTENPCSFTLDDLDPHTCALLVIDECGPKEDLHPALTGMLENTVPLCQTARAAGIPVIFACDAHLEGLDRELLLWGSHCLAGTPQAKPVPDLGFCEADYYVPKRRYSAFFQTDLLLLLDELGICTLLVTGFDTNICVRHTVADAFFYNYDTVVVTDATASFLVGSHEQGLHEMEICYGSLLSNTDDVLRFLESAKE